MDNKNSIAVQCLPLTNEEHAALKAVYAGEADSYQQRLAIHIIVNKFSRAQDLLYVPGSFDESAFLGGRAFVGMKVLKYINLPIGKFKEEGLNDENV